MKLVRQVILQRQEGSSDRVYEIDLCEVADGQFVVNFRYGRRGSVLRDGSKTPAAVPEDEATRIYEALIETQKERGYKLPGDTPAAATQQIDDDTATADDGVIPQADAVLKRLREGHTSSSKWKLSRAVWCAGELGLREAEALLIPYAGTADAMLDYCIAWSLGQCGSSASIDLLTGMESSHAAATVRRIAGVALLQVLDGAAKTKAIDECIDHLPVQLRHPAIHGPASEFETEMRSLLETGDPEDFMALELAYLIDNEHVRPGVLNILKDAPLHPNYFQRIRHIFKASELRRDAEVFGIIGYRFEKTRSKFYLRGSWYYPKRKIPTHGENATAAFSHQTRHYFRKRIWHKLRRFAQLKQPAFTRMAVGVLQQFTDADAVAPRRYVQYRWDYRARRSFNITTHYDRYSPYLAFNHLLYGNGPRYAPSKNKRTFACVAPFEPGQAEPAEREDSFPELWNKDPAAVVELLKVSQCEAVHRFGLKVLRECAEFSRDMPLNDLLALIGAPYKLTIRFAFDIAVARFDANNPDPELVLALANCGFARARKKAHSWISKHAAELFDSTDFIVSIVTSDHQDTRLAARDALRGRTFEDAKAQLIVGQVIAAMQSLQPDKDEDAAEDTGQTLLLTFPLVLKNIGPAVIRDLLRHSLPQVQRFAGDLVLNHETLSENPPDDIIHALLSADHEAVRGIGVKIIGQLSPDMLKNSIDLLVDLTRHEKPDVRTAIRPTIKNLAADDSAFGQEIADLLLAQLLIPGAPEGVPSHTARVLVSDLRKNLDHVTADTVWELLRSRSTPAQEVGGTLLATNVNVDQMSVTDIVRLGNHEILSVRESCWQMCRDQLPRMQADAGATAKLTDSRWDDTRQFGVQFIRDHFLDGEILTPDVLVCICDSVRPSTQQFGRQLITQLFQQGHGEQYVLQLSEHPSESMQMFASNFLDQHARDNPEQIQELAPYFLSVLTRVNKGRIAKDRTLSTLEREGLKTESAAKIVTQILARVSATNAILDRGRMIEILLKLKTAWPDVASPITVKPLEVRGGI